jgi:hypothetical protein
MLERELSGIMKIAVSIGWEPIGKRAVIPEEENDLSLQANEIKIEVTLRSISKIKIQKLYLKVIL